jgi:hypothetical protein
MVDTWAVFYFEVLRVLVPGRKYFRTDYLTANSCRTGNDLTTCHPASANNGRGRVHFALGLVRCESATLRYGS